MWRFGICLEVSLSVHHLCSTNTEHTPQANYETCPAEGARDLHIFKGAIKTTSKGSQKMTNICLFYFLALSLSLIHFLSLAFHLHKHYYHYYYFNICITPLIGIIYGEWSSLENNTSKRLHWLWINSMVLIEHRLCPKPITEEIKFSVNKTSHGWTKGLLKTHAQIYSLWTEA